MTDEPHGDPFNHAFWEGARAGELRVQHCAACGHDQLYGRPFCLACQSDDVAFVAASGAGTLHSVTTVHVKIAEHFDPPYAVGLVGLTEGPRLLTWVEGDVAIGDSVTIGFRERADGPPLPVARPA